MKPINYTQVSNEFIGEMHRYDGAEVKIFLAITRKTIGWHKDSDRISYSQLVAMTGLSVTTIKKAIVILIADSWIIQTNTDKGFMYDLNIDRGVSITDTHKDEGCQLLAGGVSITDTEGYQLLAPTLLKEKKETKEKESEVSVSKDISNEDLFNEIQRDEKIHEKISNIKYQWRVRALAFNLSDNTDIDDTEIEKCLNDPKFDFEKIVAQIAVSKRLRGLGKGYKKSDAVTFQSIITDDNFRQQIMDGVFDDSKQSVPVLFEDSQEYHYSVFKKRMEESESFQAKYPKANIQYYYDELKSWAKRKAKKSGDWVEEGMNFMRLDTESTGLKTGESIKATQFKVRDGYGE